jgi:hypothetical protein
VPTFTGFVQSHVANFTGFFQSHVANFNWFYPGACANFNWIYPGPCGNLNWILPGACAISTGLSQRHVGTFILAFQRHTAPFSFLVSHRLTAFFPWFSI